MNCHQCKQPIGDQTVDYPWKPSRNKKEVILRFCSEKCKTNWLIGDGKGPRGLRNIFRMSE